MKTSFDIKNITERGFKPLKMARYDKPVRGGVVGFVLSAREGVLYCSAIYRTSGGEKIGEPCPLPGLKVYLRATAGKAPGIYNLKGERVSLEMVGGEK